MTNYDALNPTVNAEVIPIRLDAVMRCSAAAGYALRSQAARHPTFLLWYEINK